jgi:hypothetical protein
VTSPVAEVLRSLEAALRETAARWYLFGAQAALVHGSARLTSDVDATVLWDPDRIDPLLACLDRHGFALRPVAPDFIARTRVVPLVHRRTSMQTDLVLGGPGLEELFASRAALRSLEGVSVPVAMAEDLIVMKILAGRSKDLDDVRALLSGNLGRLDLAQTRAVLGELEQALGRRDLLPELERALRSVE